MYMTFGAPKHKLQLMHSRESVRRDVPNELMRFPQTDEVWKKKKKIPKKRTMTGSTRALVREA